MKPWPSSHRCGQAHIAWDKPIRHLSPSSVVCYRERCVLPTCWPVDWRPIRHARNLLERPLLARTRRWISQGDLTIFLDSNQAEHALHGLKVRPKISCCFRSDAGPAEITRLRDRLATLCKQGQVLLVARETVFSNRPLYPAFTRLAKDPASSGRPV